MAYVKIAAPEEAGGTLGERWRRQIEGGGSVANIVSSGSLRPALVESFFAHYQKVMNSADSGLTPAERQMVATVTAALNRCQY